MFENSESQHNRESSSPSMATNTQGSESSLNPRSTVAVQLPLECSDEIFEVTPPSRKNDDDCNAIFKNFVNYVQFHSIQPSDIWQGRHYLPLMLFLDICQKKLGYRFSLRQISKLREISEQQNLRKEHFACLNIWRNTLVCNYQSELYPHASISRITQYKENHSSVQRMPRKDTESRSSETMFKSRVSMKKRTTYDQINSNFLKSVYSNERNKDHKLEALREDMEMNALEKKWEFVVMAGEMNKWIEETGKETEECELRPVFKIINDEVNFVIIREEGDNQEVIPEVVFVKRYKAMKKQQGTKLAKKEPNVHPQDLTKTNMSKTQQGKLNQRDKELNESLLHIMRIRNILQTQYKVLTEAAINT